MSKELGGIPNRCLKLREKSDDDEKPHFSAIVVSDGEGVRDMSARAFSRRSRFTKSEGVEPTKAWNTLWKWNGESIATLARPLSRSGSSRCPTIWSIARLIRRIYVAVVAGCGFSEIRKIRQALAISAAKMPSARERRVDSSYDRDSRRGSVES
jgi:hypothetical protein